MRLHHLRGGHWTALNGSTRVCCLDGRPGLREDGGGMGTGGRVALECICKRRCWPGRPCGSLVCPEVGRRLYGNVAPPALSHGPPPCTRLHPLPWESASRPSRAMESPLSLSRWRKSRTSHGFAKRVSVSWSAAAALISGVHQAQAWSRAIHVCENVGVTARSAAHPITTGCPRATAAVGCKTWCTSRCRLSSAQRRRRQ